MSGAVTLAVEVVNGNPAERVLVIAPSYYTFTVWCRAAGLDPRARNLTCVTNARHLRGHAGCWYVHLGTAGTPAGRHLSRVLQLNREIFGFRNAEAAGEEPSRDPDA